VLFVGLAAAGHLRSWRDQPGDDVVDEDPELEDMVDEDDAPAPAKVHREHQDDRRAAMHKLVKSTKAKEAAKAKPAKKAAPVAQKHTVAKSRPAHKAPHKAAPKLETSPEEPSIAEAMEGSITALGEGKKAQKAEEDTQDASAAILPDPVRANFKEGFTSPVAAKPNLGSSIRPTVNNLAYEESVLRDAAREAVEFTLKVEAPQLTAKLNANAQAKAAAAAKKHADANSKAVSARAFEVTKGLLRKKAEATCKQISKMRSLPGICSSEAASEFDKVKPTATGAWATAASKAVTAGATKAASDDAFAAVKDVATVVAPPVAFQRARRVFAKMWPTLQQGYEAISKKNIEDLEAEKEKFWAAAQKDVVTKVKAAVKAAIWDKPVKHANAVIVRAARLKADSVTKSTVAVHLAPFFQKAAKDALTMSIRSANQKVMTTWSSDWDLKDGTTATIATNGAAAVGR